MVDDHEIRVSSETLETASPRGLDGGGKFPPRGLDFFLTPGGLRAAKRCDNEDSSETTSERSSSKIDVPRVRRASESRPILLSWNENVFTPLTRAFLTVLSKRTKSPNDASMIASIFSLSSFLKH